jgi:hypothetical protein
MGSKEMFQTWKLILQKNNLKILISISVVFFVIIILIFSSDNSCGISHMSILNEITFYEKTLDPEFCEVILEKIDFFNETCEPQIEILDCS